MPLFYFNLRKNGELVPDDIGTEFADIGAAITDAKAAARELIGEHVKMNDSSILTYAFEIADENGAAIRTVPFTEGLLDDGGSSDPSIH